MTVEELIDWLIAKMLFAGWVFAMAGGTALAKRTPETTDLAMQVAMMSTLGGFALIALGFVLLPSFVILPRSWLRKELSRPSISIQW